MTPQIFLSLSGKDEVFAKLVYEALPHGLARIYHHAFKNGHALLDEMEKGVSAAQIVILLASKESLQSHWVDFELDQARLGVIQKRTRVLVFPIEKGITSSDYPKWLQNYWICQHIYNPKDIARYVTELLFSEEYLGLGAFRDVIGRGNLEDSSRRKFLAMTADYGRTPNVLFFSGNTQIGRRTFAKHVIKRLFPATPSLTNGPQLDLPQFADIADIYRGLLHNVNFSASKENIEQNLVTFQDLDLAGQLEEICALVGYYADRDMAVMVYTGSGLFNEDATVKHWLWPLVHRLKEQPSALMIFISNRRLREADLLPHNNALQIHVPALSDEDTEALTTALAATYGLAPFRFSAELNRAIGGHPGITKSAVRLVANEGLDLLERQPQSVFNAQTYILSHNVDQENLNETQLNVLYVLSWLPSLRGELLEKVVIDDVSDKEDFVAAIEELLLSCLIVISDEEYAISKELREIFRRRYGFGQDELLNRLGEVLQREVSEAESNRVFDANLIDSVVFMHALSGKAIPDSLKKVVLPSKFAEILRTRYNQGRDDRNILRQIMEWGEAVLQMRLDETVREEVLGILAQSAVRLSDYPKADALINEMEGQGYRSAPFIKGFRLRREGKILDAIPVLREAIRIRKSIRYSVQELATIFQQLGRDNDLNDLLEDHKDVVKDSAVLLDFEIGRQISRNDFHNAERNIIDLEQLPEDDGRSIIRKAQVESQRWGNHHLAFDMVNELVLGGLGEQTRTRRWRALFALFDHQYPTAKRDIEWLRGRNGQEATVARLEVHEAIAKKDAAGANRLSNALDMSIKQNRILRGRALELSLDGPIGAGEKRVLREEIARLLAGANPSIIEI